MNVRIPAALNGGVFARNPFVLNNVISSQLSPPVYTSGVRNVELKTKLRKPRLQKSSNDSLWGFTLSPRFYFNKNFISLTYFTNWYNKFKWRKLNLFNCNIMKL